jgi:hypothetical protein
MVHSTTHKDLQLSKKSARWVTKLYKEMKMERVRMCCGSFATFNNVLTVS